jgi:hypothetical protein
VNLALSTLRSNTIRGGSACIWMQGGKAEFLTALSGNISLVVKSLEFMRTTSIRAMWAICNGPLVLATDAVIC